MTQTPLQAEEAAGTLAAGADLGELDPTAGVVREPPRGLRAPGAWAVLALLPAAALLLMRGRRR